MSSIVNPTALAVGSSIGSGTANSVLYLDTSGNLAQRNPGFTYDGSTLKLRPNGTANQQEWNDSSGTIFAKIGSDGALWLDSTVGLNPGNTGHGFFNVVQGGNGTGNGIFTLYQAAAGQAVHVYASLGCTFDGTLGVNVLNFINGGNIQSAGGTWKGFVYDAYGLLLQTVNSGIVELFALQSATGQTSPLLQIYDDASRKLAAWYPTGAVEANYADTNTTTAQTALVLRRTITSGTPGNGLGVQQDFKLDSSTTADRLSAQTAVSWVSATDASRKARSVFNVYDTAAREAIRIESDGANGLVSIGGTSVSAFFTHKASATTNASVNIPAGTAPTSPVEGDLWNDSTQKARIIYQDAIKQTLQGVIFTQTADKSVTNTVTETSIVGTGVGGLTLPANFFVAGKTVRITMSGVYSTVAVTGDTVTIKVKYGSTVLASKATSSLLTGATNLAWFSEVIVTCRTTGATGTVQVSGGVIYQVASSATVEDELNNGVATTTLDTTASGLVDVTVTHSAANASNTVKSLVATFEILN